MSITRQDAWTLMKICFSRKLYCAIFVKANTASGFEEVGKKLSRTAAACGFRWNSSIRKQYKSKSS